MPLRVAASTPITCRTSRRILYYGDRPTLRWSRSKPCTSRCCDARAIRDEEPTRLNCDAQTEALGAYVMRPRYAQAFGCALPGDAQLKGDHVDPAVVGSIRSLRRVGPDRQVTFDTVAEITQRRWCRQSSGTFSEVFGGSTVILGPDGRVRYVIRKSLTDQRRIQAQADYLGSKGDTKGWTKRGRHRPTATIEQMPTLRTESREAQKAATRRRIL